MPSEKTVVINYIDGTSVTVTSVLDCRADEAGGSVTLTLDKSKIQNFDVQ